MKKLLILLALCMVFSVVLVACNNNAGGGEDTTPEVTTDETPTDPGSEDPTTEEATTEDATTEDATTEDPTTEESTTEPLSPEPVEVNLADVAISGSYPDLWNGSQLVLNPAVGPTDPLAVMHYGAIHFGEMDLSGYTKVTVSYATPVDMDGTSAYLDQYNATAKRVLLLNAPSAVQEGVPFEYLPAEDAIVATATYEMSASNFEITTVEIDLTEVDYNGQLYLSFDFRTPDDELGAITYLVVVTGIVFE